MAAPPPPADPAVRTVVENCAIATVDAHDTEYARGHVVIAGNRIESVGDGPAPAGLTGVARRVDAAGHLLTPGLVNTHHHFYQWLTRGLAQDCNLFDWLVTLYPVWARIDEPMVHAAAQGSLAALALSGVTTAMDHHYVFPRGAGDLLGAEIRAAAETGLRFCASRGSMDLGASDGGLPPDFAVESRDDALAATEEAIDRWHDPSPGSMLRIVVAPCSFAKPAACSPARLPKTTRSDSELPPSRFAPCRPAAASPAAKSPGTVDICESPSTRIPPIV